MQVFPAGAFCMYKHAYAMPTPKRKQFHFYIYKFDGIITAEKNCYMICISISQYKATWIESV